MEEKDDIIIIVRALLDRIQYECQQNSKDGGHRCLFSDGSTVFEKSCRTCLLQKKPEGWSIDTLVKAMLSE